MSTAFPCQDSMNADDKRGMDLRDYFAAKALTGLMNKGWQNDGNPFNNDKATRTAEIAYVFADAMLKEREK